MNDLWNMAVVLSWIAYATFILAFFMLLASSFIEGANIFTRKNIIWYLVGFLLASGITGIFFYRMSPITLLLVFIILYLFKFEGPILKVNRPFDDVPHWGYFDSKFVFRFSEWYKIPKNALILTLNGDEISNKDIKELKFSIHLSEETVIRLYEKFLPYTKKYKKRQLIDYQTFLEADFKEALKKALELSSRSLNESTNLEIINNILRHLLKWFADTFQERKKCHLEIEKIEFTREMTNKNINTSFAFTV